VFAQDSSPIGDVDCDGEVNAEDASLILQLVTGVITELPCQDNMTGLTPEQLQEMINMMGEQLSINYDNGGCDEFGDLVSINLNWSWSDDPGTTPFYELDSDGFLLAKLAAGDNGVGDQLNIYNDTAATEILHFDLTNTQAGAIDYITVPVKQGQYFRGFSSYSTTGLNTISFVPFACEESTTTPNNNAGSNNNTLIYTIDGF
tara:strand:- start:1907 stop:2515 length:609 start_codon:yes stop_codon:yes gene_type:complete